jgi:hypothetical protein
MEVATVPHIQLPRSREVLETMRVIIAALVLVFAMVIGTSTTDPDTTRAEECHGASQHSWSGTVSSYGLRDFTISFCGGGDLDIAAEVDVKGRKNVALLLIEPDGTVHVVNGPGGASAGLQGPLANGDWTLIVRNLGPSRLKFGAGLSFE